MTTPNPRAARINSLVTHTVFGFGLYLAALVVNAVGFVGCEAVVWRS